MRSLAYAAAAIAAIGIMIFLASTPTDQPVIEPDASATASSSEPTEAPKASVAIPEAQLTSLTLNVPEMHCPFACYPAIKKKLESRADVAAVELAPQKEEGVIDNRQVIVRYKDSFDATDAIAMLEKAGFGGSSVAE